MNGALKWRKDKQKVSAKSEESKKKWYEKKNVYRQQTFFCISVYCCSFLFRLLTAEDVKIESCRISALHDVVIDRNSVIFIGFSSMSIISILRKKRHQVRSFY